MIKISSISSLVVFALSCLTAFYLLASVATPRNSSLNNAGLPTQRMSIGMNLSEVNYYNPSIPFTDAIKCSSEMITSPHGTWDWDSGKIALIPRDSNGWPLQIPYNVDGVQQDVKFLVNSFYAGKYVILYDGDGDITVGGISSQVIDGKVHITLPGDKRNIWVNITRSTQGNHIRNMRIIPVAYLGNEQSMPTFRKDYVNGLKPMKALRFMDFHNTNGSSESLWKNRNTKTTYTQGNDKGVAWEYIIELSNLLDKDPWICIPHRASDDYITQLATLLKNTLEPERKIYLEFSNELWNWAFSQSNYILNNAPGHPNSYVSSDLLALCAPGSNHPEKDAYMMARMFRIFATVFKEEMSTRVVRIATGQHAWADNSRRILHYLFVTNKIGADALSVAGYFSFKNTDHATWVAMDPKDVTPELILQSAENSYSSTTEVWTKSSAAYAKQYGVDYLVYEGGQHMQPYNQQDWAYNHAVYDAQIHPGMYKLYLRNLQLHNENDVKCKLFMAYSYVSKRESKYGSWGHLENLNQIATPEKLMKTAPKYKALLDFIRKEQID